jgi:hypothetical protein
MISAARGAELARRFPEESIRLCKGGRWGVPRIDLSHNR